MIVDTSALYAYFVRNAPGHWAVTSVFETVPPGDDLIVSPFVVGELDAVIATRFGDDGQQAVFRELSAGAWRLAPMDEAHLRSVGEVLARHPGIGSSAASVVALAAQHDTREIVTLRPLFAALHAPGGGRFEVMPAGGAGG